MLNFTEFLDCITEQERNIVKVYLGIPIDGALKKNVLEIGSGWGLFTRSMIQAHPEIRVTTIDKIGGYGLPSFKKYTEGFQDRFERIEGDSHVVLKELAKQGKVYDLIFVDGDHRHEGAHADLHDSIALLRDGGTLMIDDVFHRENFSCIDHATQQHNFGVASAFGNFLADYRDGSKGISLRNIRIENVGHGLAIMEVEKRSQ